MQWHSPEQAIAQGIKVVSFDADVAPDARTVFVNQANSEQIGRSEVDLLASRSIAQVRLLFSLPALLRIRTPGLAL